MIKIGFRKNLLYLFLLVVSFFLRRTLEIILDEVTGLHNSLIFCFLMCLGQIIGGALIYWYQKSFFEKKEKILDKKIIYELIQTERELRMSDDISKIRLLVFFAAFFDLEEFIITDIFIPKIADLSKTITLRLCCIMTITSSLICTYTLKYKIGRHQIFSLTILGMISLIIIIIELIYRSKINDIGNHIISYFLVLFHSFFISLTDVIERYLVDYDYINAFEILMLEGIASFIITAIYSIFINPFKEISIVYKRIEASNFILLIFLLFLFIVLSAFINIYKILCNILYSPMAKSLSCYFLTSIFIIYHYINKNDFMINGEQNIIYFLMSLVFSVLIDIFGLIYNEFFILKCFGLSKETYDGISVRAKESEIELSDFKNDNIDNIDNEEYVKTSSFVL